MIFLSHNSKDKPVVQKIALHLERALGKENVFYDEWSIQPGDSIIEKMSEGIKHCKYFFFFVSQNSLKSKMVSLEWQSALMKLSEGIKFVCVRLDDSELPDIIKHIMYIDLFTNGPEVATRQIIDVINGDNTFRTSKEFYNLVATVEHGVKKAIVTIKAQYYMEPHSRYLLLVDNDEADISWSLPDFSVYKSGFNKNISFTNGLHHCILVEVDSATSPNFPVCVNLETINTEKVDIICVMHATSRKDFSSIPTIHIRRQ